MINIQQRLKPCNVTFIEADARELYCNTPERLIKCGDTFEASGQTAEEYILSRVKNQPEIKDYERLSENLKERIKLKLTRGLNPMQTELAVIRNRDMKFIVLERFSGSMNECQSINEAKNYVQRNVCENSEFIILEVKAIAGPKKPEVQWDSLEEQFEPVED